MKNITWRPAVEDDVPFIADRMREADRLEVAAMGLTPRGALRWSMELSDYVWTGLIDGTPSMMFGCGKSLTASTAQVWALGTDECTKAPREMLVYGRKFLKMMLDIYPEMYNFCDARYAAAHRWLRKLGFTVGEPEPYGLKGEEFCKITISKGDA
jgi:hypothetical protein